MGKFCHAITSKPRSRWYTIWGWTKTYDVHCTISLTLITAKIPCKINKALLKVLVL